MTEPQTTEAATEEERKRRTIEAEPASKAPANANALKAPKEEGRSGLRSQGSVDVVAADKPAFVRAYNKAPNLDRPFDAVDMDEKAEAKGSTPLVTGPVVKPTEGERTKMPADDPPAPPTPLRKPAELKDATQDKALAEPIKKKEATDVEETAAAETEDAESTDSDEESAVAKE